jgi:hypothetical protein
MKAIQMAFVLGTLLGVAGIAHAQVNLPNPQEPGGSLDSAVRIIATSDLMVDRHIRRWLRTHYPGWDADPYEYMMYGDERYAVVYITSKNNPGRRVYFRVKGSSAENDNDDPFPGGM